MSEPIVLPIWLFLVIGLATTLGAYCWGVWAACNVRLHDGLTTEPQAQVRVPAGAA